MDIDLINVQVNGEPRRAPSGQSVAALLAWLEVPSERVAVELNKSIVRKRDWTTTRVEGEACIEIVEFVGGG
jgi:sulfur carrier protein